MDSEFDATTGFLTLSNEYESNRFRNNKALKQDESSGDCFMRSYRTLECETNRTNAQYQAGVRT
jgi:hypothetical protein